MLLLANIAELLSGAHINYWHCAEIVEILKDTEKDTKNFFGQYGSQRMALWKDILGLYQRENVYLAEAAQLLTQAVTYDLPGKKNILPILIACCCCSTDFSLFLNWIREVMKLELGLRQT